MIICYHRSSSLGTFDFCQMKYFFQYVLGFKDKTNKKALMGTIVHRALQVLGDKKLAQSKGEDKVVNDDIKDLTFEECDDIDEIVKICFDHYTNYEKEVALEKKDLRTCTNWTYKALAYKNGELDPRNQNIFATEQFFDIEIKKDWAKYDYEVNGEKISGYLSIKGTIDVVIQEDEKYFQVLDYKGLPLETPILTTNGWTTMGDIELGDIVYDRFGEQTEVVAKSRVKNKECYKITFDDKKTVECDDEHYWTLSDNSVVQAPDIKIGMKIDVAKPIDNASVELPIDPYVLGMWLGDGRNRGGEITSGDTGCFEEIKIRGREIGEDLEKRTDACESRTVYGLTSELKQLNLINNKHIPEIYFRGSIEQRLDLLRGLMDSDGSVNPIRKQCIFMNRNRRLSEDTTFLLRTLGQRPYLCVTRQMYKGREIECYPVFFRPTGGIKPFNLDKKNKKIDKSWGDGASSVRRITSIEKIGKKKTQCISVDSPDSTYLCTKYLIPTHNTGRRLNWATGEEKTYEDLAKDKQLLLYYYALKNLYPDYSFYVSIYYINDGGIFDLVFDEQDYLKAEEILKKKFEEIRDCKVPRQLSKDQSHWKCTRLCRFSETFEDTGKSACQHFHDMVQSIGIKKVTEEHADISRITKYGDGGGRIAE